MINFYKDKQQITNWLDKYQVKNYTLIPDEKYGFVVDGDGDINLNSLNLTFIPVKFNTVKGKFYCYNNQLTSLEFCPQTVGTHFSCANNALISLKFCPQKVDGSFSCGGNQLTSLEFSPQTVGSYFNCGDNKITSLEFCPITVVGIFDCYSNKITSLEFCPQTVAGSFYCHDNSELKEIQKITNFKEIYLEHKKILIIKFSDKLENNLLNDKNKKSTKIKI